MAPIGFDRKTMEKILDKTAKLIAAKSSKPNVALLLML